MNEDTLSKVRDAQERITGLRRLIMEHHIEDSHTPQIRISPSELGSLLRTVEAPLLALLSNPIPERNPHPIALPDKTH